MNTKLHAVTERNGRPIRFVMTAGQISDHTGAAALLDDPPLHFRPEISRDARELRQTQIPAPQLYRDHVRPAQELELRRHTLRQMPDRLLSAVCLAATVMFWL